MLCRMPLLILLVSTSILMGDEPAYRLDRGDRAGIPKELAAELQPLMAETPLILRDHQMQVLAEVWIRKVLPVDATPNQVKNGLTYEEIPEGTLLGAIRFPNDAQDYRKQRVPAGVYTLRLAQQPQVGDHDGTAPFRTFALVLRAKDDRRPDVLDIEKMHQMSARVTEGHPSPWMFFPPGKDAGPEPRLLDKGKGHWVLFWKQEVKAGDLSASLGFGLTLIGVSASR